MESNQTEPQAILKKTFSNSLKARVLRTVGLRDADFAASREARPEFSRRDAVGERLQTVSKSTFQWELPLAIGLALFLLILPFHLVVKKLIPDPLGTYWKEIWLGLLIAVWGVVGLRHRKLLWSGTALDVAVLIYLGLLLLRFGLDRSSWTGAWGLYMSVLYLPLFWLTPMVLRRYPHWATGLVALLVGVMTIIALGGLIEFVLDKPLWPSDELLQRYGSYNAFIYGTHLRRVYFTFDSPTALANTLAMLLPLALALMLLARRNLWRMVAGVAAVLIAVGIVLTFSRGIWVASILALVVMGALGMVGQRNWRVWLMAVGTLTFIGLAWGVVVVLRPSQPAPAYVGVVDLPPEAYRTAPVTGVAENLLSTQPAYGTAITQTWTLFDSISGHDDTRSVLYEHPLESGKEEIIYRVNVPEGGALRFAITLSPEVWSPAKGDGTSFQVYVVEPDKPAEGRFVFVRYINPKSNPNDRRWLNFLVDLSPWASRMVNLSLITEDGPTGNWTYDWAGWADLQLVGIQPDYFNSVKKENVVLHYTGSILDWTQDETNRDRLAAWGLALEAWRAAPLWGNGLGSTGAAALRTDPSHAFVTESQVLKALVELGLPGLLVLAYLWFQIGHVGYLAYRKTQNPVRHVLLLGLLASLLIVFVEGWVYQNLEVKQVNAYFWILVGLLAFLAKNTHDEASPLSHSS